MLYIQALLPTASFKKLCVHNVKVPTTVHCCCSMLFIKTPLIFDSNLEKKNQPEKKWPLGFEIWE